MKLYPDYKKLFNIIVLVILFLTSVAFSHAQNTIAQNTPDLQAQIDQKNSAISSLEQEIAAYQSQLDSLGEQKDSLNTSLKELDLTKKNLNANIAIIQNKIDTTNLTIDDLSSNINTKQNSIATDTSSIINEIQNTNEFEKTSILETLLSGTDFTSAWNDIDNIATVREKLRQNILDLTQMKGELENTRTQTVAAKNELTKLKSQLSDQRAIVVQNTNDKNKLLTQTKNSEANYQALLKDRITKRDAFEKEIADYEAQLQFILDPSKLPSGRVLSWPLDNIFVTQLFGKTVDSKRLYASGSHSGVDFRASVGTPVMSMADGTVVGTGNTDLVCAGGSFGKFIFIQYDNGLSSTFGHLSLIKVSQGEQVKRGEVVGYSGATGHVTGPHLHVSLYAPQAAKMGILVSAGCGHRNYIMPLAPVNAYLNVLDYLPPYIINSSILNNHTKE